MKKKHLFCLLIVFLILKPLSSFSEGNYWVCTNCRTKNTTNFCPNCGAKHPDPTPTPQIESLNNTTFIIRNGIQFGDSKELVQEKETFNKINSERSRLVYQGDLFGIPNTQIEYIFKTSKQQRVSLGAGKYRTIIPSNLKNVLISLGSYHSDDDIVKDEKAIIKELTALYGPPIASKNKYSGLPWLAKAKADIEITKYKYGDKGKIESSYYWIIEDNGQTILIDATRFWTYFWTYDYKQIKTNHIYLGYTYADDTLTNLAAKNTPLPSPTKKPTPLPTETVNPEINKIKISSLRIGKNSIGSSILYIVFKNSTSYTVDRIDFNVKCYDAYGRKILGYNYYDSTNCFYDDRSIKSGGKTPSDIYWTLYGFEGTKAIDIVITGYHTTNGITVRIPESQWNYVHYK